MNEATKELRIIGRAENISLPEQGIDKIPARIDTGAKTSAIWASNMQVKDGVLSFVFFDKQSQFYNGVRHNVTEFAEQVVASSNGMVEKRFRVQLLVKIRGKKIRAAFTLANRSTQVYPVLIGRNVLTGKFVVDVKKGKPQREAERLREAELQSRLKNL